MRGHEEGEIARGRGVDDPLQVRVHGQGELRLGLALHDSEVPLCDVLPPEADHVAPALEAVE